ncbi:MAG: GNAT family N-acetyltransferase [Bacteroidetes bacterium]|nr:GNAT family N-acetyltransferase [Bacteroidota bacterium]
MKTTEREATEHDMDAEISLIQELAIYEKAPNEVEVTANDLILDGFGEHPLFYVLVAEQGKEQGQELEQGQEHGKEQEQEQKIVGMAFWLIKYSTWKGKILFLEDLIVSEAHRQEGIGKMLMDRIVEIGKEMNVRRIDWEVLDWNEPAISLYKKYNARFDGEWVKVSISDKEITAYTR